MEKSEAPRREVPLGEKLGRKEDKERRGKKTKKTQKKGGANRSRKRKIMRALRESFCARRC